MVCRPRGRMAGPRRASAIPRPPARAGEFPVRAGRRPARSSAVLRTARSDYLGPPRGGASATRRGKWTLEDGDGRASCPRPHRPRKTSGGSVSGAALTFSAVSVTSGGRHRLGPAQPHDQVASPCQAAEGRLHEAISFRAGTGSGRSRSGGADANLTAGPFRRRARGRERRAGAGTSGPADDYLSATARLVPDPMGLFMDGGTTQGRGIE